MTASGQKQPFQSFRKQTFRDQFRALHLPALPITVRRAKALYLLKDTTLLLPETISATCVPQASRAFNFSSLYEYTS